MHRLFVRQNDTFLEWIPVVIINGDKEVTMIEFAAIGGV